MQNIVYPLIGGAVIGLASSVLLFFLGKIAGISGIVEGLFDKYSADNSWKFFFVAGLILGGVALKLITPDLFSYELKFSYMEAVVAGLLVGFGTRLGSGCTSGHGVCGLPRFSLRSLVATIIFMGVAVVTVFIKGAL